MKKGKLILLSERIKEENNMNVLEKSPKVKDFKCVDEYLIELNRYESQEVIKKRIKAGEIVRKNDGFLDNETDFTAFAKEVYKEVPNFLSEIFSQKGSKN